MLFPSQAVTTSSNPQLAQARAATAGKLAQQGIGMATPAHEAGDGPTAGAAGPAQAAVEMRPFDPARDNPFVELEMEHLTAAEAIIGWG